MDIIPFFTHRLQALDAAWLCHPLVGPQPELAPLVGPEGEQPPGLADDGSVLVAAGHGNNAVAADPKLAAEVSCAIKSEKK